MSQPISPLVIIFLGEDPRTPSPIDLWYWRMQKEHAAHKTLHISLLILSGEKVTDSWCTDENKWSNILLYFIFSFFFWYLINLLFIEYGVSSFAKSISIKWKEGRNLIKIINERSKSKPGNNRCLENTSFFEWYVNSSDPSVDKIAEVTVIYYL